MSRYTLAVPYFEDREGDFTLKPRIKEGQRTLDPKRSRSAKAETLHRRAVRANKRGLT